MRPIYVELPVYADRPSLDPQASLAREKRAIERAQTGDLAALEPLLAQHAEALFACVMGRLGDRATAEDLVKDTLLTAFERIGTFRWQERSIYHWLRQIALHKIIDHHRQVGRRKRLCLALKNEASDEVDAVAHTALSAEEERQRAKVRIEGTLVGLHPRYAEAIRLRLCEERPRSECAQRLGVAIETFDVLLFRAVRAFRKAYGEPDGDV